MQIVVCPSIEKKDSSLLGSLTALAVSIAAVGLLSGGLGCNDHPVRTVASGDQVHDEPVRPPGASKLDLLWVIDNSGTMCQEQRELQRQFPEFVKSLRERPVDLNVAVTTTDMGTKESCQTVAPSEEGDAQYDGGPGCIQSRPRPSNSVQKSCRFTEKNGMIHDGEKGRPGPDYGPVRKQLERALTCVADRDGWEHLEPENIDRNLIECAEKNGDSPACEDAPRPTDLIKCKLDGDEEACAASERPTDRALRLRDLFPPRTAYRDIPEVLRTSDYERGDGTLRLDDLRRDFACMSTVGTRGSSFEKGLKALVRAVSPERTGGPVDVEEPANPDAPNHGFLRKNAKFGAVFVTDENDCTHTGELEEGCGDAVCYFPNQVGEDEAPMVKVEKLYTQFRENLAASKGVETVREDQILLGTIHGGYKPFQVDNSEPDSCPAWRARNEKPFSALRPTVCKTQFGEAYSGDRYEEFLRQGENFFPELADVGRSSGQHMPGELCHGGLREAFRELGRFFNPDGTACIERRLPTCENAEQCPSPKFEMNAPVCREAPVDEGGLCTSSAQVRLVAPFELDEPESALLDSGFCIEKSLEEGSDGIECVVRPSLYEWTECDGGSGVTYRWKSADETGGKTRQIDRRLAEFGERIRYRARREDDSRSPEPDDRKVE